MARKSLEDHEVLSFLRERQISDDGQRYVGLWYTAEQIKDEQIDGRGAQRALRRLYYDNLVRRRRRGRPYEYQVIDLDIDERREIERQEAERRRQAARERLENEIEFVSEFLRRLGFSERTRGATSGRFYINRSRVEINLSDMAMIVKAICINSNAHWRAVLGDLIEKPTPEEANRLLDELEKEFKRLEGMLQSGELEEPVIHKEEK